MESLSEKLVKYVAVKRKLNKQQAIKFINKCLEKISIQENTSYHLL